MKTMKKIAALLAATIMTGMITVPFTASAETSADIPNGWTITYGADTPESEENYATFTTEEAHGGEWSLVAHSPAEMTSEYGRIIISHPAGLPKGGAWDETGKYTVEFYTKGIETSADMWGVRAGTFGHQHETSINGTLVALNGGKVTWGEPDSDGWRKVSFDFAYPYTDTTQSDFKIIIRATPDIRDVYFDDVRVYYVYAIEWPDSGIIRDANADYIDKLRTDRAERLSIYDSNGERYKNKRFYIRVTDEEVE